MGCNPIFRNALTYWYCVCNLVTSGTSSRVTKSLVVLPCLKLSLIWHTKVKAKSNWSIKTSMKADHNTITPFGVKVMSKYKVSSKCKRGMIKKTYHGICTRHRLLIIRDSQRRWGITWYSISTVAKICLPFCDRKIM